MFEVLTELRRFAAGVPSTARRELAVDVVSVWDPNERFLRDFE